MTIFKSARKTYWIVPVLILLRCVPYQDKQVERVKLSGINGEAYYIFKTDNTVWGMYKLEHNNADYQIIVYGDTVLLGTEFEAMINVPKSQFKIIVDSPDRQIMLKDSTDSSRDYHFKPGQDGVYDFRGRIQYDTTVALFDYKFIVVKED